MPKKILIVDDDPHIREVVAFALETARIDSKQAKDGAEALLLFNRYQPDLIILDISMPEMDGFNFCKTIRTSSQVPILFLSSRSDEIDRVVGFEIGGDDYVPKPFSPRELVARVQAILKRCTPPKTLSDQTIRCGNLVIHTENHSAAYHDHMLNPTAIEFSLLSALLSQPKRAFSRNELIDQAYGHNIHVSDRTVDSHIRNIRKKLTALGCDSVIETVHGVGFKAGSCL